MRLITRTTCRPTPEVDPRARGGGCLLVQIMVFSRGQSPLTRGRPRAYLNRERSRRSIPAHAGEAPHRAASHRPRRVDPRSRGGGRRRRHQRRTLGGQSPLTRGRRIRKAEPAAFCGSIPAHAGEADPACPDPSALEVNPRSRGGGIKAASVVPPQVGQSPLTRGRPQAVAAALVANRSIPAHAGEASC